MPKGEQRQHYITKSLMEHWADADGNVGVVCLHHRRSACVRAESLHWLRKLSSNEREQEWGKIESQAKDVIDELVTKIEEDRDNLTAAQDYLAESPRYKSLVDLAILHHGRSLIVALEQYFNGSETLDSAESEATILQRMDIAQDYHDCGLLVTVVQSDTPSALGAVPVFDTEDWGGYKPGTGRFMMPLTPRVYIAGTPDKPMGEVEIVKENLDPGHLLWMHVAGEPGQFHTPFLICELSALENTTSMALAMTEGTGVHWHVLHNRLHTYAELIPKTQRYALLRTADRYEAKQAVHRDATTTNSRRAKLRRMMIEDAREVQAGLDSFDVPICACSSPRHDEHPGRAAMWKSVMPQVICEAMRRQ